MTILSAVTVDCKMVKAVDCFPVNLDLISIMSNSADTYKPSYFGLCEGKLCTSCKTWVHRKCSGVQSDEVIYL